MDFLDNANNILVDSPIQWGSKQFHVDAALQTQDRFDSKQEEIFKRRERIEEIKSTLPSITYSDIQKTLKEEGFENISIQNISKDVQFIEEDAWNWADSQALGGLVAETKQTTIRFKKIIEILTKNFEDASPREKPMIAKQIHDLSISILDLKAQHGTFDTLKRANSKLIKFMASPDEQRHAAEFRK